MRSVEHKKPLVFVGLSGGVDSSVAAARLVDQGYRVVGVFIKVWEPEFLKCDAEKDRLDAMRVAAHLGIPFMTLDAAEDYKKEVGEYFVGEYLKGRTPNPDVMCNRHVKFGAFWRFAQKYGADFIATGHYAQIEKIPSLTFGDQSYKLLRGKDPKKDQSYFLWTLTPADLAHILFPVGDSTKEDIRIEAVKRKLPTAAKKDSQGICFLGHVDVKEFLSHFASVEPGKVVDESGSEIGRHDGALVYTLGQRHGFTVFGEAGREAHFVVAKDMERNTITVDTKPPMILGGSDIVLKQVNVLEKELPADVEAQTRYRQFPFLARIVSTEDGSILMSPQQDIERPAIGQSVVFYRGDECLGGGVVE
jgi:tRNA-specific 2-thiouridylase